ncbi:MAG TPA: hypothetical protein VJ044_11150, partial [Candidatus Hodarchaeales archaeon]|nr:hypothetical protein [Candidatus Hodarchaeales archaeon]
SDGVSTALSGKHAHTNCNAPPSGQVTNDNGQKRVAYGELSSELYEDFCQSQLSNPRTTQTR